MRKIIKITTCLGLLMFIYVGLSGCSADPTAMPVASSQPERISEEGDMFVLISSAFENNGAIPEKYAYKLGTQCKGENYSPPLGWSGAPAGTESFLLTVIDPDGGNWVHWLLVNIPADLNALTEVVNGPEEGIAGHNSFGKNGYGGPCPPSGTHRYIFTLYALDTILEVEPGVSLEEVTPLFKNHILAQCQLVGLKSAK